jgi:Zn-dependent protease
MVAAAGPLANLLIAMVAWNVYRYGLQAEWESVSNPAVDTFVGILVGINLLLMVFNLIPLGPLDGHYILPYFLPRPLARRYVAWNAQYGGWFFMGLILLSILGVPIFNSVFRFARSLLPYITLV